MPRTLKTHQLVELAYLSIPKDKRREELVNRAGTTDDIIRELLKTDAAAWQQTAKFAQYIAGPSIEQTLKNVWKFTKENVHYLLDGFGTQKIKTPSAIWHSRQSDCKGYAMFIRSILKNLKVNCQYKFAGYSPEKDYTHVYVIVPKKDGSYTTLDGCMPAFNEEKPTVKYLLK